MILKKRKGIGTSVSAFWSDIKAASKKVMLQKYHVVQQSRNRFAKRQLFLMPYAEPSGAGGYNIAGSLQLATSSEDISISAAQTLDQWYLPRVVNVRLLKLPGSVAHRRGLSWLAEPRETAPAGLTVRVQVQGREMHGLRGEKCNEKSQKKTQNTLLITCEPASIRQHELTNSAVEDSCLYVAASCCVRLWSVPGGRSTAQAEQTACETTIR